MNEDAHSEEIEQGIEATEALSDLSYTPEQRRAIRERVEKARQNFRALREVALGYDVEPLTVFRPGGPPAEGRTHFVLPDGKFVGRPETDSELAFMPVVDLARLVASKAVSPVELAEVYLNRLSTYGPGLRCLVTLTEGLAREQARAAESEILEGRYRGPLHGVPWGAKDLLATAGIPTTWGATPFRKQVIDKDATVVSRLREAGAVLVGKLSLGALAQGPRWFEGTTRNPWDPERTASGSSAGPGAATAAGLVGFSIGSETLGSIVSPSEACGVVGLRPTYGRVSRHGAMALSWSMDKLGPMCRSVEDCAAAFAAIHGPDGKDPSVVNAPFPWEREADLRALRIGYLEAEFEGVEEEGFRVIDRAALDTIRALGADLQPVRLSNLPIDAIRVVLHVEAAAAFDDLTRSGELGALSEYDGSNWPESFRAARLVPAVEYLRAQRVRSLLTREMTSLFEEWDVILAPGIGKASLAATNLSGHPAVILPCGFVEGSPRGLTWLGGHYQEAKLLASARIYEQATDWRARRPDLTPFLSES